MGVCFFIYLGFSKCAIAQVSDSDTQLAIQYYQNKEFDKALPIMEKLFESTKSRAYFIYYLNCLSELNMLNEAEKLVKKQIKKEENKFIYMVDLGYLYKNSGKNQEAMEQYNLAISKMPWNNNAINELASAFISRSEFDYAETVYMQGALKTGFTFHFELANLYTIQRNYTKMSEEYLKIIDEDYSQMENVKSRLYYFVQNDMNENIAPILQNVILKKIQNNPKNTAYIEMLIWLYTQAKNFKGALIQEKALDKQMRSDGKRIYELGNLAVLNEDIETGIACFQYIIEKGLESPYFISSRLGILTCYYKDIKAGKVNSKEKIAEIVKIYEATIAEFGRTQTIMGLMLELANIKAFYLGHYDEAIQIIENALIIPGMMPSLVSDFNICLADIYVLKNLYWEAILLYAQIENTNKENPIGSEAKFRKARLSYFMGDIDWAQSQLDILKASTSKLIANDAMSLSVLISEAKTDILDSNYKALKMYSRADLLKYQQRDSFALRVLDSFTTQYAYNPLMDDVYFMKYLLYFRNSNFLKAKESLEHISEKLSQETLADDAFFFLAEMNENIFNDQEKAKEQYKFILMNFPGSIYSIEARKRFRKMRGENIEQ